MCKKRIDYIEIQEKLLFFIPIDIIEYKDLEKNRQNAKHSQFLPQRDAMQFDAKFRLIECLFQSIYKSYKLTTYDVVIVMFFFASSLIMPQ